jgi:hypothetical protein
MGTSDSMLVTYPCHGDKDTNSLERRKLTLSQLQGLCLAGTSLALTRHCFPFNNNVSNPEVEGIERIETV